MRAPTRPAAPLRQRAESHLKAQPPSARPSPGVADTQRLLHELQVHQVELEMQNAELQGAQERTEIVLKKYTDLYDFAPVGYFSLNEAGLILEANRMACTALEWERSHLIRQRLQQFAAPACRLVLLAFLKRIFAGAAAQDCAILLLKRSGAPFWASIHGIAAASPAGAPRWCRVSITDITDLKLAEQLLRRNERLFADLIQQAPVGVYVVDDQLRVHQVNPKAEPVFRNLRPVVGRTISEVLRFLWPRKVAAEVLVRFRHTLASGEPYDSPNFTARRRDLRTTECHEWQLQRITLPNGQHGVVCFFNDVTERRLAEGDQRRLEVLSASNHKLEKEIIHRQSVETALVKSKEHESQLLARSLQMQEQLRRLSRHILQAQEAERKVISRELHDQIAQTLAGINLHLETLSREAQINTEDLRKTIASTKRLVENSVETVHRFARELRPAVLDDLGLIPALHSYLKEFTARTSIPVQFTGFAGVEKLSNPKRTVLYRVAQSALNNVAQHARASRVTVSLRQRPGHVILEVQDNGRAFNVKKTLDPLRNKRLGLLGMRERIEMVGGSFRVESTVGSGTLIHADIPFPNTRVRAPARKRVPSARNVRAPKSPGIPA